MKYRIGAGQLDERITLRSPVWNSPPDTITGYADSQTVWAAVRYERGQEIVESDREVSVQLVVFLVRFAGLTVDTTYQVRYRSVDYDVRAIEDIEGKRELLKLTCRAVL